MTRKRGTDSNVTPIHSQAELDRLGSTLGQQLRGAQQRTQAPDTEQDEDLSDTSDAARQLRALGATRLPLRPRSRPISPTLLAALRAGGQPGAPLAVPPPATPRPQLIEQLVRATIEQLVPPPAIDAAGAYEDPQARRDQLAQAIDWLALALRYLDSMTPRRG